MADLKLKVEAIRAQLGLSQEDMAKKLGIERRTYQLKIYGKTPWYFNEIQAIADMVGIPIGNVDTSPVEK